MMEGHEVIISSFSSARVNYFCKEFTTCHDARGQGAPGAPPPGKESLKESPEESLEESPAPNQQLAD